MRAGSGRNHPACQRYRKQVTAAFQRIGLEFPEVSEADMSAIHQVEATEEEVRQTRSKRQAAFDESERKKRAHNKELVFNERQKIGPPPDLRMDDFWQQLLHATVAITLGSGVCGILFTGNI